MSQSNPQYLIFSDLDGTLLDEDSYSFYEAREALECLREKGIPLILCSSKTRAEIEVLRREINNQDPFIVENGGAVFFPPGVFSQWDLESKEEDGYRVVEFGTPYQVILSRFKAIKEETGIKVLGFSEMSVEEISGHTGLDPEKAALARQRKYSEPFIVLKNISEAQWLIVEKSIRERGLILTEGGRFYHLSGPNDKGRAARLVITLYQRIRQSLISIGLGDSPNDFPMLRQVDIPVLIKRKTGDWEPWPFLTPVYRSPEIGPRGWNAFILNQLKEEGQ